MEVFDIIEIPNPILNQKTQIVTNASDKYIQDTIERMFFTMQTEGEHAVGLSAPQVGISLQICTIKFNNSNISLLNPKIEKLSKDTIISKESCLSIPNKQIKVERHKKIMVSYQDRMGIKRKIKTGGFLSILLQHEIDHLNGILIVDKKIK